MYKRAEGIIERTNEKIKVAGDRAALMKKLAKVEGDYRKEVEAQRALGGETGAEKYERTIAANPDELQGILLQRAKDELEVEMTSKEAAVRERAAKLLADYKAL